MWQIGQRVRAKNTGLRRKLSRTLLRVINLVSGAVILCFAGWQLTLLLR